MGAMPSARAFVLRMAPTVVAQVAGKIIGFGSLGDHWDGTNLKDRLTDELADLMAALDFVVSENGLDAAALTHRTGRKLGLFQEWHRKQQETTRDQIARAAAYTDDLRNKGQIDA